MADNGQLAEKYVLDLNSPDLKLPFENESIDVVVCANTMEYLTNPRAVFREVYRVLKPKGVCQVLFLSKGSYTGGEDAMAKYWTDFTDAQKMYVGGSFFQFTSGGWSQLKGYDLSSEASKQEPEEEPKNPLAALFQRKDEAKSADDDKGLFAVSAVKAAKPPADASPMRRMQAELWDEFKLLPDERRLCCERLYAQYQARGAAGDLLGAQACVDGTKHLAELYSILEPMSKALPVTIRALIASNLAPSLASPNVDSEAVLAALNEGLGLAPPREEFWKPVGELTSGLIAEDKIWLLLDFVPLFGQPDMAGRLKAFPSVLKAALATVETKLAPTDSADDEAAAEDGSGSSSSSSSGGEVSTGDQQLLAVELAITDYLLSPEETPESFAGWLEKDVGEEQLRSILSERKAFTASASKAKGKK